MKTINVIMSICMYLFINSCSTSERKLESSVEISKPSINIKKKYYTLDEYMQRFKENFLNEKEETYFGLTSHSLNLLNKKFQKASKKEIEEDIAYNKKSIKINKEPENIMLFLKEKTNLKIIAHHLNYQESDFDFTVTKNNKAIISFLHQTSYHFSNEIYLISIENNIIKIKLINYLVT